MGNLSGGEEYTLKKGEYIERKGEYIKDNVNDKKNYSLILSVYSKSEVIKDLFTKLIDDIDKDKDDFDVMLLIRFLLIAKKNQNPNYKYYLTESKKILDKYKFWLERGETVQCYWSENHLISYISSLYLWNQLNSKSNEECLKSNKECLKLLTIYIESKCKFLFHEFLSQVYLKYTLNALLNIYDFIEVGNSKIIEDLKSKVKKCINIIIQQFIEVSNTNGIIYCAQGRTYDSYRNDSTGKDINKLLYLLTGKPNENGMSPIGVFLATSTYEPDNIDFNVNSDYENTYSIGYCDFKQNPIFSELDEYQKIIFQLSAGLYFNYENITDTIKLFNYYDLYKHKHFGLEKYKNLIQWTPSMLLKFISFILNSYTGGSKLTFIDYHIYNNNNYTLTSAENYNKGLSGAQQFVWVANVNGSSVYTQSGNSFGSGHVGSTLNNSHLPYIKQNKDIIIMMYRPGFILRNTKFISKYDINVYLKFIKSDFDEVVYDNKKNWLFGNKQNTYIAIYSTSLKIKKINSDDVYYNDSLNQCWIIILGDNKKYESLGDNKKYESFDDFKTKILTNAKIKFSLKNRLSNKYIGSIDYNNKNIEIIW